MSIPGVFRNVIPRALAFVVLAAVLLQASAPAAQDWRVVEDDDWCDRDRGRKICEIREITLPAGRDVIDISGVNGSILVEGWDRDEIYIKAKISVKAKSEQAARDLLGEIEISTDPRIRAEGPKNKWLSIFGSKNWSVSYRMMVPVNSNLDAHTTNGSLRIADVTGAIDCGSTNGGLKLYRINGDVYAGTVNGGISVELEGDVWDGRGLELKTTNGGVTVEMPSSYSARIEAKTTNGGIRVEHPVRIDSKGRGRLKGTIGDGGPVIKVRTVNGGVKIRESA